MGEVLKFRRPCVGEKYICDWIYSRVVEIGLGESFAENVLKSLMPTIHCFLKISFQSEVIFDQDSGESDEIKYLLGKINPKVTFTGDTLNDLFEMMVRKKISELQGD
ncbi:hypothetical protein [Pseudomonas putida]|uniref:Uncharacterized protein n=1 Tax=Pseudomonas putida TaxID=303 RepID=A0A8I1EB86_PSEPU|nr:hypothetical protein [Pseudomonas putida]MBI6882326.1 hypothetical protein [Pseudomonas putida]